MQVKLGGSKQMLYAVSPTEFYAAKTAAKFTFKIDDGNAIAVKREFGGDTAEAKND